MSGNTTQITVLVENTAKQRNLLGEHGLAFLIERNGKRILFDTGQGLALQHNAATLGLDLSNVDTVALSHGHYDHTGGLLQTLPCFSQAKVYVHASAFCDRFSQNADGQSHPVRSPIESLDWLSSHVGKIIPIENKPVEIGDGIWLTGQIPRQNDYEDTGGAFYLDEACTKPDLLIDDQAMFMETAEGIVVLLGCAHSGVVNTLEYICKLTGPKRIHAVIGGMHLLHADENRMAQTIQQLLKVDIKKVGLAHCTGFPAMARLYAELPDRCFHAGAGTQTTFE